MSFQDLIGHFFEAFFEQASFYLLFSVPLFLIFWVIWKKKFQRIRIQTQPQATTHHFKHDLWHSGSSLLVFAVMDIVLLYLQSQGYTRLYSQPDQYGWWWLPLSFALLLFLNDTFFYWSHRAMHHPKLYPIFHRVHHESTDPSPLTSFSFHPSEALVENAMGFLLPFIFPLHIGVIIAWQLYDMLNNVVGHLGYEVYPKGWTKIPILKYKTPSTHHNMHHQLFDGNYALYFTWWDKWMGTEFKDYETRFEAIFDRKPTQEQTSALDAKNTQGNIIKAKVTAQIDKSVYHFEVGDSETILQAALAQQIPLPHSCKRGLCGTCKLHCTSGSVQLQKQGALTDAEVEAGYILTCQALPLSDVVSIEG